MLSATDELLFLMQSPEVKREWSYLEIYPEESPMVGRFLGTNGWTYESSTEEGSWETTQVTDHLRDGHCRN